MQSIPVNNRIQLFVKVIQIQIPQSELGPAPGDKLLVCFVSYQNNQFKKT